MKEIGAARSSAVSNATGRGGFGERGFGHLQDVGRLGEVEHIVQSRFGLRMEAGLTGELEAEVLFADPDFAAVFAFAVAALVEVVREPAGVAEGFAVLVE